MKGSGFSDIRGQIALPSGRDLVKAIDRNLERYFLVGLYFYLFIIICIIVFGRYVFSYTPVWGANTAVYLYIYLTWIGAAWNIRRRRHIRVDLIQKRLSERGLGLTYILNDVATLLFVYFVFVGIGPVWSNTLQLGAEVQTLSVSQIYFFFAIPFGFALITIRTLQVLYWDVMAVKNGTKVYEGEGIIGETNGSD